MRQKKYWFLAFFLLLLVIFLGKIFLGQESNLGVLNFTERGPFVLEQFLSSPTPKVEKKLKKVTIDFGDGRKITEEAEGKTVYAALEEVAKKRNLEVKVKSYKFGVKIEKIGNKENQNGYLWQYFVNGNRGIIGADKYLIYQNDVVEWKYIRD